MKFEDLPNEIFFDLFEYFNGIDLVRALNNLNSRFDALLFYYLRKSHFDFRGITKTNFYQFTRQYLPSILHHITSLHLSDDDQTPNLSQLFIAQFSLQHFDRLQSLYLYHIHSFDFLTQCISQCSLLSTFKHLTFDHCSFVYQINDFHILLNQIWNLSKLISLRINHNQLINIRLTKLFYRSLSLKLVYFENLTCNFKDLSHLILSTPNLRQLSVNTEYIFENEILSINSFSLTSLKISYQGNSNSLVNLIKNLSNLIDLTIETWYIYFDGNDWMNLVENFRTFRLKMNFQMFSREQIDQLIESFRTKFWLIKRKQYVRCEWDSFNRISSACLYTLPYVFKELILSLDFSSKSTDPNEDNNLSYKHVRSLRYYMEDSSSFSRNQFPNLQYLKIRLASSFIHFFNLDNLISLEITLLNSDFAYQQLQILFNQTPRLYSLKISYSNFFQMKHIQQFTHSSIRRIDFLDQSIFNYHYFNFDDCQHFIQSSLGRQCEILTIAIEHRQEILLLINNLPNLCSFTFHCQDDQYTRSNEYFHHRNQLWIASNR